MTGHPSVPSDLHLRTELHPADPLTRTSAQIESDGNIADHAIPVCSMLSEENREQIGMALS